jgi:hypothetical protein
MPGQPDLQESEIWIMFRVQAASPFTTQTAALNNANQNVRKSASKFSGGLGIEPEVFDLSAKQQFAPIIPVISTKKPLEPGAGRGKRLDHWG